ncbi:RNA ligase family protein [Candidatus Dojkabacteria bacterium]|jgi:hypothetical protein|nr:RNA ligase family protein [Candidatus Dojkabacteria bacterium]
MKFPRIPHLIDSPGKSPNDLVSPGWLLYLPHQRDVVVTEKMDGECTGMTREKIHARSEDSKDHPSRHWVKNLHAQIKNYIPRGVEIFGENLYAKHSIYYSDLPSYFLVFAVTIVGVGNFLEWEKVEKFCNEVGLHTVPVLYKGNDWKNQKLFTGISKYGGEQEGYVIRNAYQFGYDQHAVNSNYAKWVRLNHIQTDEHWLEKPIIKNKLEKLLKK